MEYPSPLVVIFIILYQICINAAILGKLDDIIKNMKGKP